MLTKNRTVFIDPGKITMTTYCDSLFEFDCRLFWVQIFNKIYEINSQQIRSTIPHRIANRRLALANLLEGIHQEVIS